MAYPFPRLRPRPQIESLIDRLGDEGLAAIADTVKDQQEAARSKVKCGKLARHPVLIDCLYLIRNGVPFDVAFSLSATERAAYVIALGTLGGHTFDWSAFEWVQPTTGRR